MGVPRGTMPRVGVECCSGCAHVGCLCSGGLGVHVVGRGGACMQRTERGVERVKRARSVGVRVRGSLCRVSIACSVRSAGAARSARGAASVYAACTMRRLRLQRAGRSVRAQCTQCVCSVHSSVRVQGVQRVRGVPSVGAQRESAHSSCGHAVRAACVQCLHSAYGAFVCSAHSVCSGGTCRACSACHAAQSTLHVQVCSVYAYSMCSAPNMCSVCPAPLQRAQSRCSTCATHAAVQHVQCGGCSMYDAGSGCPGVARAVSAARGVCGVRCTRSVCSAWTGPARSACHAHAALCLQRVWLWELLAPPDAPQPLVGCAVAPRGSGRLRVWPCCRRGGRSLGVPQGESRQPGQGCWVLHPGVP